MYSIGVVLVLAACRGGDKLTHRGPALRLDSNDSGVITPASLAAFGSGHSGGLYDD